MAKFSQAGKTGGGLSALEKLASQQVELPTGPQEEVVAQPQPAPAPVAADPSVNLRQTEDLPAGPQQLEPQQQLEADLAEQQRQSLPNLRERWAQVPTPDPISSATASTASDGGVITRANRMAAAVQTGGLIPPTSLANTAGFLPAKEGATGSEIAEAIAAEKEGSIQAAMNRVNAVDNRDPRSPVLDPDFVKAGSMVTENMVMQFAGGGADVDVETVADPITLAQEGEQAPRTFADKKVKRIAKQQGNAQIGQQIAQEYQRLKGKEVPDKIPPKEAETLGDAFKMMWAAQNPDLVNVTRDPNSNQKFLELTPQGEDVLASGVADRKRLFPPKNIRPAKTPLRTGQLPGDVGQNVARKVQGGVGQQKFEKTLEDSMRNLAQVPNVVDKQRMKILFATALPVLQNFQDPNAYNDWRATINNIGSDKVAKYTAAHGPEVAQQEMLKAAQKLANEIKSIAQERNGANYLSYSIQGFQGRVSPQQRWFNPTTSKAVRFATRNAVPAPAKPGSRVDYNLRQMYAMMLVKGADEVLPHEREIKFEAALPKLKEWGDKLTLALQMSDAEAEAIATAIDAGTPLTDPSFPQIGGLQLDPEVDAELIDAIRSKGEDGPHFIDGLMDLAKYADARKAGRTHHSYFNAYIDGKTNGIASNGIQMGNSKTARQTGVIRESSTDYLDQPGDVRAVLKDTLMEMLDTNGFDGNVHEFSSELSAVARAVFNHRDLNKKTTMTFGYGKEIDTFGQDMYDTAQFLKADPTQIKDPKLREEFLAALPTVEENLQDSREFGGTLMTIYGPALESVMSPEALATRSIMRGSAVLHAATNQLMSIKGPTGMDLNFGRDARVAEGVEETRYKLRGSEIAGGEQQVAAYHQATEPTSAAARTYTQQDAFTGEETVSAQAGDYAYGGSVVGPVQALDAATVALTSSGKSWNRLKQASGGNPYIHTIYDAFKADAMGFDVVLEEVNQNWLDASMNWSYLKETQKSTQEAMADWKKEIGKRRPEETLTENERAYMDFILKMEENAEGKPSMKNFYKKIGTAANFTKQGIKPFDAMKQMAEAMRKVNYDWMDPPKDPNVLQLRTFVGVLEKQLKINERLSRAIGFTEKQKQELRKEIMKHGYKTKSGRTIPLQYYAH